jgi:S-DNA-T family DNA segregation ATPase FtsK/SpoIIIE
MPVRPPEAAPPGFPVIATVAPVALSVVLFAVTGSPFMLMMAALGPAIAVATFVDGRRQRRRSARLAAAAFAAGLADVDDKVRVAREAERHRLEAYTRLEPDWSVAEGPVVLAIGRGAAPSGIDLGGLTADDPPEAARRRGEARLLHGVPQVRALDTDLVVEGAPVFAVAAARTLVLRWAARCSPESARVEYPSGEEWARLLPHETTVGPLGAFRLHGGERPVSVGWGPDARGLRVAALDADATSRATARSAARRLADAARAAGLRPPGSLLPVHAAFGDLLPDRPGPGLEAPVGVSSDGPLLLDLVADGPHALVAGTTGAGKSELLVSWVLGMAAGRTPDEVGFVLVDFKGGAAFAPLAGLPHVLGTVSDLDERLARRALESLRAEVLRRERALLDAGARSIAELPAGRLARLVVVVDEFAALVTGLPELHALFADLAARGRSLGVHLILCTQRPAGVVRDAVLANIAVRIALRVADRADSIGLLGDDSAARLPVSPRGRAIVVDGSARHRPAQIALATSADVDRIARATPPARSSAPWCDPLPTTVAHDSLPATEGIPFGLSDLPAQQRQPAASVEPRHGHVLVLGAPGTGRTTALAAVAAGAGERSWWLPTDPAELWDLLVDPAALPDSAVLLLDDLDLVLARCPADHALELADLVGRLLRDAPGRDIRVVASARRLAAPIAALAPAFGARLLLRLASREEHLLAGGDGTAFDPRAAPGSGHWDGAAVQVALAPQPTGRVLAARPPQPLRLPRGGEWAVVAARPGDLADRWNPARVRVVRVGEPDVGVPVVDPGRRVLLGDPDAWQADWSSLTRARRDLPMVFVGCAVGDVRAVARVREAPPPLRPGEVWLVEGGRVMRALLPHAGDDEAG